jgi:hypothetical protein
MTLKRFKAITPQPNSARFLIMKKLILVTQSLLVKKISIIYQRLSLKKDIICSRIGAKLGKVFRRESGILRSDQNEKNSSFCDRKDQTRY